MNLIKFIFFFIIFRLSLMGGRKVHESIINNIQDLAKVFSSYHEEVLVCIGDFLFQYIFLYINFSS